MSDSHDNLDKVSKAIEYLRKTGIDLLIHLGDIVSPFTLIRILQIESRAIVILGNNDGDALSLREIAHKAGALLRPHYYSTEIDGLKTFMMHGHGPADQTLEPVEALARSSMFDIVMYGHTHKPEVRTVGRTIVLNPGEVCGCLYGSSTIALLDTRTRKVKIVDLD